MHTCVFVTCSSTPFGNKAKEVPNVGLCVDGVVPVEDGEGAVNMEGDSGEEGVEGRGEDMGEEEGDSGEEGVEGRGEDMGMEVGGSGKEVGEEDTREGEGVGEDGRGQLRFCRRNKS